MNFFFFFFGGGSGWWVGGGGGGGDKVSLSFLGNKISGIFFLVSR